MLPKLPVQETFYASQSALYNFCITDLLVFNPEFYTWIQCQAGSPNGIRSALYNFLRKTNFPKYCNPLRLFWTEQEFFHRSLAVILDPANDDTNNADEDDREDAEHVRDCEEKDERLK
ncbi:hypothetical protein ILUMI_19554 [Ignelater luminosus]|uniref:Uncharacterized protein n=1 Tax=Ignelater luminosus TaxID=2038154 RepID=A0A8K0FZT0_IGNLU|nr:hypothetical protein ILUMI_19554 [Ignelater luminosus]